MPIRSVSVSTTMTGASPSVLIVVGGPPMVAAISMPASASPSGAAAPPRLWTRNPSYWRASGWTPLM
jgi:hypothetical protein